MQTAVQRIAVGMIAFFMWFHSFVFGNHNTYHTLVEIATESFRFYPDWKGV